jgi:hypothetical protein
MSHCEHETITQLSNVVAETYWMRTATGVYELATAAQPVALSRVLAEDTASWTCDSCGTALAVDPDGRLQVL